MMDGEEERCWGTKLSPERWPVSRASQGQPSGLLAPASSFLKEDPWGFALTHVLLGGFFWKEEVGAKSPENCRWMAQETGSPSGQSFIPQPLPSFPISRPPKLSLGGKLLGDKA